MGEFSVNGSAGSAPRSRRAAAPGRRVRNPRGEGGRLRGELIDAARRLLSEAGAESDLTIRGVTRAAGVHPQAFYLHFDSLDDLLFAVYTAEFAEFTQALQAAAAAAGPGLPALRAICRQYARFAVTEPASYRLLMSLPGQPHPEWDPQRMPGSPALRMLADTLAAAREADAPDAPAGSGAAGSGASAAPGASGQRGRGPDECAVLLWASLHGLVTLRVSRPAFPWPPIEQAVDAAVDAVLAILA